MTGYEVLRSGRIHQMKYIGDRKKILDCPLIVSGIE